VWMLVDLNSARVEAGLLARNVLLAVIAFDAARPSRTKLPLTTTNDSAIRNGSVKWSSCART